MGSAGKIWLSFNKVLLCRPHGLMVTALASKSRGREFKSRCGQEEFFICKSRFRSLQLEEAHANEINREIHLANTLFQIKVRYKKYGCRLQWFITVHVSLSNVIVPIYDHLQLKQSGNMPCLRTRATTRARTHYPVFSIALTITRLHQWEERDRWKFKS